MKSSPGVTDGGGRPLLSHTEGVHKLNVVFGLVYHSNETCLILQQSNQMKLFLVLC